ncbi:YxiG family protein [Bacillus nakamurai]|uniref:YxiG family protein n=1 Tax=Bacillus nakamurai TaxID=1793963 RepID=UPI0020C5229F|nr:hypothetical protein [Bacillus nakamurai]MCP6680745.1 hypothetical protein [Bacillus nakamurai]
MCRSLEEWVDYLDTVCTVLQVDYQFFKKELHVSIRINEPDQEFYHDLLFRNVSSFAYYGGRADERFEEVIQEEMNWQFFEFSFHPGGIGILEHAAMEGHTFNPNFLIDINTRLLAIEAGTLCIDGIEYDAAFSPKLQTPAASRIWKRFLDIISHFSKESR